MRCTTHANKTANRKNYRSCKSEYKIINMPWSKKKKKSDEYTLL